MMRTRRILAWTAAAVVLGVVFTAWLDPHLAVTIADQIRSCF